MTAHDVLVKAKAQIDSPEKWCQNNFDLAGRKCSVAALFAGADQKLNIFATHSPVTELSDAAMALRGAALFTYEPTDYAELMNSLCAINNSRTHEELMAVFDRAIDATKPTPVVEEELVTA